MLVAGVNDSPAVLEGVADFVAQLRPAVAYLAIPTRPPAEEWAQPPDEETLNRAYQIFSARVARVECLTGYEGAAFGLAGNVVDDLLGITAVHPMRVEAVGEFLAQAGADWSVVNELLAQGELVVANHAGHRFLLRRFRR